MAIVGSSWRIDDTTRRVSPTLSPNIIKWRLSTSNLSKHYKLKSACVGIYLVGKISFFLTFMTSNPNHTPNRPLPWYHGPKLAPFQFRDTANAHIEIYERLGSGLHSTVYRAQIEGKMYALKIFCFWRIRELVDPTLLTERPANVQDLIYESHPFYAECRAYGRLKETGNEGLALPCHGYVVIPKAQEEELDPYGTVFHRRETNKHDPLYAIVKDLLPIDSPPFSFRDIPAMRRNVLKINNLGIVIYDLRAGNYMNGVLIDLSQANTVPHRDLRIDGKVNSFTYELCTKDFWSFDRLMDDWNEEHPNQLVWKRFLGISSYRYNLRQTTRPDDWWTMRDKFLHAARYDWQKPRRLRQTNSHDKGTPSAKTTIRKALTSSGIKKKSKARGARKRK
ncbi:hypothetical protein VHEMI02735 [[Torrubiella] hemipterigena]|uniref:Protein kinase domain-containing protein n=1 Tax=[Torrubiella] hemipterigena TaxID=1531966 RepID=A0A0A1T8U5_9HYPO|nr:hypothetical protein VHEMI02735 [[Torrubiella] hemipterigena]